MRPLLCVVVAAWLSGSCGRADEAMTVRAQESSPGRPSAVLVELFTSEGCSSCPPADSVLTELVRNQPFAGVTIVGMGEHVDYWDRLGWRDPFSSPRFTSRQSEYEARTFHTGSIYTPQVVIDGDFQEIGSDRAAVMRAIARAARLLKADISVTALPSPSMTDRRIRIQVDIPPELARHGNADVIVAAVEDDLVTKVERGENHGRTLRHSRVARTLTVVGAIDARDRRFSTTASIPVAASWNRSELHAVAFVQERQTRRVIGVASVPMTDGGGSPE